MKFFASVALICAISVVCGHGAHLNKVEDEAPQGSKTASYLGEFKYLYKTYQDCAASDLSTCLKLKLYTAINRLARSNGDFKVSDSVTFVKDEEAQSPADEEEAPKTEGEIESELPRSLADKDQALNSLIFDKIVSFFENHTLKLKFPSADDIKHSIEEARQKGGLGGGGKDKKHGHYIMIPLLLGSTLVPLAFGALALLAGKALIVSKLALALASIIGIKKLIQGGHHHDGAHEVVVAGGGHSGGWGRNSDVNNLAYKGYKNE